MVDVNIDTAKNIHSLMLSLNRQEDKLKEINKIKEEIQMTKGLLQGEIILRDINFNAHIRLNIKEIFELCDFLSSYWTMEKCKTAKSIEEL